MRLILNLQINNLLFQFTILRYLRIPPINRLLLFLCELQEVIRIIRRIAVNVLHWLVLRFLPAGLPTLKHFYNIIIPLLPLPIPWLLPLLLLHQVLVVHFECIDWVLSLRGGSSSAGRLVVQTLSKGLISILCLTELDLWVGTASRWQLGAIFLPPWRPLIIVTALVISSQSTAAVNWGRHYFSEVALDEEVVEVGLDGGAEDRVDVLPVDFEAAAVQVVGIVY